MFFLYLLNLNTNFLKCFLGQKIPWLFTGYTLYVHIYFKTIHANYAARTLPTLLTACVSINFIYLFMFLFFALHLFVGSFSLASAVKCVLNPYYNPICGSDNRTYGNRNLLNCYNRYRPRQRRKYTHKWFIIIIILAITIILLFLKRNVVTSKSKLNIDKFTYFW